MDKRMILGIKVLLIGAVIGIFAIDLGIITLMIVDPPLSAYLYIALALLVLLIALSLPILWIIFSAWKLVHLDSTSDQTKTSFLSILRSISHATFAEVGICVMIGLPFSYALAQLEDAPGLVVIGLIGTGCVVVAAIVMWLIYTHTKRLLQH